MENKNNRQSSLVVTDEMWEEAAHKIDTVKTLDALQCIPGTEWSTTQQVADFFGVAANRMSAICSRYKNATNGDGMQLWKLRDFIIASSTTHIQPQITKKMKYGATTLAYPDGTKYQC